MRFKTYTYDWSKYCCGDFLKAYSTNSLSWDKLSYEDSDGVLNLHYGLIHNGAPTLIDTVSYNLPKIIEDMPKSYELCKNGDVIFADASEDTNDICKPVEICETNGKPIVSGLHTIHTRDYKNLTCVGFKGYLFSSKPFHKQVFRLTQGTKIFSINFSNFREMSVFIPRKEEQLKIVEFLSKIDDRISTQSKIIEDIETLRKWIINQQFARTATNAIGEFIEQTSERNKTKGVERVLSVSNKYGFINQSEQFEDREVASDDRTKYKIVRKNDFAFNPARINVGSIAKLDTYDIGIVSPMYICFKINNKNLDADYLSNFFASNSFKNALNKRLEGSVRQCLQFDALCDIKLFVPSLNEQSSFVSKIKAITEKLIIEKDILSAYKKQKAYLLSNMFI